MAKQKKRQRKRLASCERKSDRRTAEFVVRRIGEIQDELSDLLLEFRAFEHFDELDQATYCLRMLQTVKKKYITFADSGVWSED